MSIECHVLPAAGSRALTDVAPGDATGLHHGRRDMPETANQVLRMRY